MNFLQMISNPGSVHLGWALIHSLWQGLIIALLLEIALGLVGRKNASLRYFLCCLALAAFPIVVTITYVKLDRESPPPVANTASLAASPVSVKATPLTSGPSTPSTILTVTEFTTRDLGLELNRFMPFIVVAWFAGVLLLTGRKAGGFLLLWHLRQQGVSAPDNAMLEVFRQACTKIGIDPAQVCLKISSLVQVPMTMGWIRPVILFPAALLTGLSAGEIELLLAHELAHIRRHDYLVNLLQTLVETLFFYHPATWWISSRMRQERENRCDDLVAARSGNVLAYAKVLLQLESLRTDGALLAPAASGGDLLQRVRRLLGEPAPTSGLGLPTLTSLLSILGVITAMSMVEAQTNTPEAKSVPATPEASFAQPITVKETPPIGASTTRLFSQGGEIILQQTVNMSPGSIGQIVFYKHVPVVDDRRGTTPISFSSREILPTDFKIRVQSIAADNISPAALRILDSHDQIITEFFIDPTGLMRPITKAEHDANIEKRKAALTALRNANPAADQKATATDDSFIVVPKDGSGDATLRKLKSIVLDEVNFQNDDVAKVLEVLTKKSSEIDPEKKGVGFVLADLSHLTPADHVHREISVVLESIPLDQVLGYICTQTNLKCSIRAGTVHLDPPARQTSHLIINRASYEAADGTGAKDVTGTVSKMLKDDRLEVPVDNDVFGGDPAWLHVKQLRVVYTLDGNQHQVTVGEGSTLHIPEQPSATNPNTGAQAGFPSAGGLGAMFGQLGKMMESQAKVLSDQSANLGAATPGASPAPTSSDSDPFALPSAGSFGQLGKVMEIHVTSSRQLAPGVLAVHYYSQYRGLASGLEGGVTWGGEIAVYGLSDSTVQGGTWKGLVYPAGHMTFGWDRLSVYTTTKEQAIALASSESEQDRKSFPP